MLELLDAGKPFADWIERTVAGAALSTLPSMYATAALTHHTLKEGIPGDFVECGVCAGVHPAIMAHVCQKSRKHRQIHLFDSFKGIPHASEEDKDDIAGTLFSHGKDGKLVSSGISVCPLKSVQSFMKHWRIDRSMLVYHEGWFQDTVPAAEIGEIAMLRLDGDLYESTKVCMEHLYNKVVKGGFVIIDDWPLAGARAAVVEYLGYTPEVTDIPGGLSPVFWRK